MKVNHPFDRATSIERISESRWCGTTSDPYANMVGPFGGFISAVFLQTVLKDTRHSGDPVSLTVNFCGSIADGGFEIATKLQRGGKYTQHWSMELSQENGVRATASIILGMRGSVFSHQARTAPSVPEPDEVDVFPDPGLLKWTGSYTFRFIEGRPHFTGKPFAELQDSQSILWVCDRPVRPLDYLSLASIADTFLLRPFHMRGSLPPMGTVSLTTYFHATQEEINRQGDDPLLGVVDTKRIHANFHDHHMELWGRNGDLLASGVQVAWYKE